MGLRRRHDRRPSANPSHTYTANGTYTARLTVTDVTAGKTGTATVPIIVGNTRPTVTIFAPPDGGFFEFGDSLPYAVSVTDPEETVDCSKVIVQPALGHDEHAHPETSTTACSGTAKTFLDEGHAEANAFWVIDARYTDSGGQGGSQPLTASATSIYRPKRFQAHYYDDNSGVAVEFNAAAENGQYVGAIQDNDWIKYEGMNFSGIDGLRYRVSAGPEGGGRIEARIGSPTGQLIATTPVNSTGGWFTFATTATTPITVPAGKHDVYLVFRSNPGVNWSMTLDAFEAVGAGVGTGQPVDPKEPRIDRTTGGDWVGKYGKAGYFMPLSDQSLPTGVTVTPNAAAQSFTSAATSTLRRALQRADGNGRRAATWFNQATGAFDIAVDVPAGKQYDLDLYFTNYDNNPREQTVQLVKRDGTPFAPSVAVSNFVEGQWVGWTIDEPVTVQVRKTSGNNTVMSGLFLSEVAVTDTTAPTVAATANPAPNAAGWHRTLPLTIAIAGDDGPGSGIDALEYALGDAAWTPYSAPVAITADTASELRYRATDKAGNVSVVGTLPIKVDTVAPTAAANVTPSGTITLSGADARSGLDRLEYALDDGAWTTYTAPVEVTAAGAHTVRYRATDVAGNVSEIQQATFTTGTGVTIKGTVPSTLALTFGEPAGFGVFTPGVARTYAATTTASVISSAGDATLSVADTGSSAPGHLVNGAFSLPSAVRVSASSSNGTALPGGALSGALLPLLSYTGPQTHDAVSIAFSQAIGVDDRLRTGDYGKTLTFTLSTTAP